jgi:phenylacetate-CoA ligase
MRARPAAHREHFDEAETAPPQQLEQRRWQRISRVLAHVGHLPFYRDRFHNASLRPGPVRGPEEFAARVPTFRKADLVAAISQRGQAEAGIEALQGRRPCNIVMTSGTLGFNTFAFLTPSDLRGGNWRNAVRELWMVKVRPGMRVLTLSPAWHILALLDSLALSHIRAVPVCPWGTFVPRFSRNFLEAVRYLQPEHMLVTTPILRAMLAECRRAGTRARDVFRSVRYVACAGEAVSPAFRQEVIQTMGLEDFFERGGSSDGMFGGGECFAHRGHHIFADLHYIEIIDPKTGKVLPPGQRGSAVVTNLTLGRSVYVRFDTEDVAEVREGDCPCGRTHPVVELYGRLAESVLLAGRIIAPYDVRCVVDTFPEIRGEPFAMEPLPEGDGLRVAFTLPARDEGPIASALAARLSQQLGARVVVDTAGSQTMGWKGQVMRGQRGQP